MVSPSMSKILKKWKEQLSIVLPSSHVLTLVTALPHTQDPTSEARPRHPMNKDPLPLTGALFLCFS